jgi:hypothetical protein
MSLLAPLAAAPRLVLAPAAVLELVPPLAIGRMLDPTSDDEARLRVPVVRTPVPEVDLTRPPALRPERVLVPVVVRPPETVVRPDTLRVEFNVVAPVKVLAPPIVWGVALSRPEMAPVAVSMVMVDPAWVLLAIVRAPLRPLTVETPPAPVQVWKVGAEPVVATRHCPVTPAAVAPRGEAALPKITPY